MWRQYYQLTKPGIIRGNVITAAAGYGLVVLGSEPARRELGWAVLAGGLSLLGLGLIVASACVANNILDRRIDARMDRTKRRALVTGAISVQAAAIFSTVLGFAGTAALVSGGGWLAVALALFGWLAYVVLYGAAKRRTAWGTLVGSISGAIPPVVGYTAAGAPLDAGAGMLFALMVCWQMPHFYAIALARRSDYSAASLPVLPLVRGDVITRRRMIGYVAAYLPVSVGLVATGRTGLWYALGTLVLGGWWLTLARRGWAQAAPDGWASAMYRRSLMVIGIQSLLIALGGWLP